MCFGRWAMLRLLRLESHWLTGSRRMPVKHRSDHLFENPESLLHSISRLFRALGVGAVIDPGVCG